MSGQAANTTSTGDDVRVNTPGVGEDPPNCNIQSEVSLARFAQTIVAGWNDSGECAPTPGRSISGYGYSTDGGRTWTDGGVLEAPPDATLEGDPVLAAGPDGDFYYATLADDASSRFIIGVSRSTDGGRTWSVPVDASPGRAADADKPWLAVDSTASVNRGAVYVAWTEQAGDDTFSMLFSRSIDGGLTFEQPLVLEAGEARSGPGVQLAVDPDGQVYALWVDAGVGRIWFTSSVDGGSTFTPPGKIAAVNSVGHTGVCGDVARLVLDGDIRIGNWPSLAVDLSGGAFGGRIYLAVPHDNGGLGSEDEADIAFLFSEDGGSTWTGVDPNFDPTVRLNDDETSNDQFHPQVAVDDTGTVAVSWYDRRLSPDRTDSPYPAGNRDIDVFARLSTDGGATFGPSFAVTDRSFPPAQTNPNTGGLANCYMGEYNAMIPAEGGGFMLAWGDNRDTFGGAPDPNVYFDRIDLAPPTNPTLSSPSHTVGEWSNDATVDVTWTGADDDWTGVDGFSFMWDTQPGTVPDDTKDAEETGAASTSPELTDGDSHWFHLRTVDGAGNWSETVHLGPFRIDTAPPAAGILSPGRAFKKRTRFPVTWEGDDTSSGLSFFDVRVREAGLREELGDPVTLASNTEETALTYRAPPGTTACFSVMATDRAGNASDWSAERCTNIPLDDRALIRRGAWDRERGAGHYLGAASASSRKGASLLLPRVEAAGLALLVTTCPGCGVVEAIWRGEVLERIDLSSKDTDRRVLIELTPFGSVQRGGLRIEVVSSGLPVLIDGVGLTRV